MFRFRQVGPLPELNAMAKMRAQLRGMKLKAPQVKMA